MNKFISRCRRHDDSWDLISLGSDRLPAHNGGVLVTPELSDRSCSCSPAVPVRDSRNLPTLVWTDEESEVAVHLLFRSWRVPSSPVLTIIIATTSSYSWRIPLPLSFLLICEDAAALSLFWRRLWCGSVYWERLKWKNSIMCLLGRGNVEQGWSKLSVW